MAIRLYTHSSHSIHIVKPTYSKMKLNIRQTTIVSNATLRSYFIFNLQGHTFILRGSACADPESNAAVGG